MRIYMIAHRQCLERGQRLREIERELNSLRNGAISGYHRQTSPKGMIEKSRKQRIEIAQELKKLEEARLTWGHFIDLSKKKAAAARGLLVSQIEQIATSRAQWEMFQKWQREHQALPAASPETNPDHLTMHYK